MTLCWTKLLRIACALSSDCFPWHAICMACRVAQCNYCHQLYTTTVTTCQWKYLAFVWAVCCHCYLSCRLATRVSAQLPERKATFSKGRLMHVSDLLQRNSMTRSQNLPPVASFLDATSSGGSSLAPAAAPAAAKAGPSATAAAVSGVSPAAAAAVAAGGASTGALPSVSVIARGAPDKAPVRAPNGAYTQQAAAISARDVQLEVAGAGVHKGAGAGVAPTSLSAAVASLLQQPAPAGAHVVRDIQISKLAGELDLQT